MSLSLHAYIEPASEDKPNVLLGDAEPAKRFVLAEALAGLEHNLYVAGHWRDVLKLLLKRRYAAVLLDPKMTGINGFEIAAMIRGRPLSRHTPLLFLAAQRPDKADVQRAYALGAVDYLHMPVQPTALRAKICVLLELERVRHELFEAYRRLERYSVPGELSRGAPYSAVGWPGIAPKSQ